MKIFTTLAVIAAFGLVWGCSSDDSSGSGDAGTGATGGGGTGGGGTGGMAGMAGMGAMGGMGATGGTGGGDAGPCDMNECATTECAQEIANCDADADCKALLDCAGACTDTPCVSQCLQDNPNGATKFGPVATCLQTKCADCE